MLRYQTVAKGAVKLLRISIKGKKKKTHYHFILLNELLGYYN